MKRSYYNGIALDYTAQEYDDEYSLCDYYNKYYNDNLSTNTSECSNYTEISVGNCTIIYDFISCFAAPQNVQGSEEYSTKESYNDNIWLNLKYIFCCYW